MLQNILGITTAQDAICSLPLPIGCMRNIRTQDTNQTAQPPYKTMKNVIISTCLFFFSARNFFPSLQNLQWDAEQVSEKTNLPSDLRAIAANKGFVVSDNQASENCLFHSLSEQLQSVKGIRLSHKELRKTLVQFLDENPNLVG